MEDIASYEFELNSLECRRDERYAAKRDVQFALKYYSQYIDNNTNSTKNQSHLRYLNFAVSVSRHIFRISDFRGLYHPCCDLTTRCELDILISNINCETFKRVLLSILYSVH